MKKTFKRGDRVFRLGDGWSRAKHGEEGKVLAVNASGSLKVRMDNGHTTPNGSSKKFALVTPRNSGNGDVMNKTFAIKVESQTLVNGEVITDRTSDEALYSYITAGETAIAALEKMKAQPKSVKNKIAALQAGIDEVVAICNARTEAAA